MENRFCQNCGAKLEKDSIFCHECGSSVSSQKEPLLERSSTSQVKHEPVTSYPNKKHEANHYYSTSSNKKKEIIAGIIIAIIIFGSISIIIPITLLASLGPFNYNYLGTISYSYDSKEITATTLDISNRAGDISITYNHNLSGLLEASIAVYGRKKATMDDAITFSDSISNNKLQICFDSWSDIYNWFSPKAIKYDLNVVINPQAAVDFYIISGSGRIFLDLYSPTNTTITDFNLISGSGDIDVEIDDNINFEVSDFNVKTTSGNNHITFSDNVNINANSFSVKTGSGNIDLEVGSGGNITSPQMKIETNSGRNQLIFDGNNHIKADTIRFSTGSGNMEIISESQGVILEAQLLSIDVSSGDTDFCLNRENIINIKEIELTTGSGDITFDLGRDSTIYTSEIIINTSSGYIDIIFEQILIQNDISWDVETGSGDISLILEPTFLPSQSYRVTFDFQTSSGQIDIGYMLDEDKVGVKITADTSSGDISLPGGYDIYQSDNYDSKVIKYSFELQTGSGDISVY